MRPLNSRFWLVYSETDFLFLASKLSVLCDLVPSFVPVENTVTHASLAPDGPSGVVQASCCATVYNTRKQQQTVSFRGELVLENSGVVFYPCLRAATSDFWGRNTENVFFVTKTRKRFSSCRETVCTSPRFTLEEQVYSCVSVQYECFRVESTLSTHAALFVERFVLWSVSTSLCPPVELTQYKLNNPKDDSFETHQSGYTRRKLCNKMFE